MASLTIKPATETRDLAEGDPCLLPDLDVSSRDAVLVDIADVRLGSCLRTDGINSSHVEMLAEVPALPPVVLHRGPMTVVDGTHRILAARLRGETRISAVFVDGSETEAFVLAVR